MSVPENLRKIRASIPDHISLVAVSKTKTNDEIMEAYHAGQRIFGENKIQEMTQKYETLPKDIQWHMIGHVQRNKVKYMAAYVAMIHGVDSLKLLKEIDKQAKKHQRIINCLFQMHIAEEETKFGLSEQELNAIISSEEFGNMEYVNIVGLMGMATNTDDVVRIKKEFEYLRTTYEDLILKIPGLSVLSMGMSADYVLAIEKGSNMIRVGSSIFGQRNYH